MKILFADYETGLLAGRKHEEEVLKKITLTGRPSFLNTMTTKRNFTGFWKTPMPWSLHFSKSMMKS